MLPFNLAAASVQGRDNRTIGKNNQDSWHEIQTDDYLIAIVTDGCGDRSSAHSELGAQLGAQLVADTIAQSFSWQLKNFGNNPFESRQYWELIRGSLLLLLDELTEQMGQEPRQAVKNNFLFTVLGCVITKEVSVFFTIGDGYIVVNGEMIDLPDYHDTPPYLAYGLIETAWPEAELEFQIRRVIPTAELDNFLLASDGLRYLIGAENKLVPGKKEPVGPISQFWQEDVFFTKKDALRARLAVINRDCQTIDWAQQDLTVYHGHLLDDTTIIAGRRAKEESDGEQVSLP